MKAFQVKSVKRFTLRNDYISAVGFSQYEIIAQILKACFGCISQISPKNGLFLEKRLTFSHKSHKMY